MFAICDNMAESGRCHRPHLKPNKVGKTNTVWPRSSIVSKFYHFTCGDEWEELHQRIQYFSFSGGSADGYLRQWLCLLVWFNYFTRVCSTALSSTPTNTCLMSRCLIRGLWRITLKVMGTLCVPYVQKNKFQVFSGLSGLNTWGYGNYNAILDVF